MSKCSQTGFALCQSVGVWLQEDERWNLHISDADHNGTRADVSVCRLIKLHLLGEQSIELYGDLAGAAEAVSLCLKERDRRSRKTSRRQKKAFMSPSACNWCCGWWPHRSGQNSIVCAWAFWFSPLCAPASHTRPRRASDGRFVSLMCRKRKLQLLQPRWNLLRLSEGGITHQIWGNQGNKTEEKKRLERRREEKLMGFLMSKTAGYLGGK